MQAGQFGRATVVAVLLLLPSVKAFSGSCGEVNRIGANGTQEAANAAYALVDRFYGCLFGEFADVQCRNLLDDASLDPAQARAENKRDDERWAYLRNHQRMFITPRYESSDERGKRDFFSKAAKSITYFNIRDVTQLTYGEMYLSLASTTMGAGKDGIYKEVSFPISCDPKKGEYRIGFLGIKINGVLINPYGEFSPRKCDLLETLGLRED